MGHTIKSYVQCSVLVLENDTVLRLRNGFNHFSDVFSQFTKHIAPAFNHERPERSVQMRSVSNFRQQRVRNKFFEPKFKKPTLTKFGLKQKLKF